MVEQLDFILWKVGAGEGRSGISVREETLTELALRLPRYRILQTVVV